MILRAPARAVARLCLGAALLLVLATAAAADATAIVHMVKPGDTLASIAELYYGDPRRESVLVAENGLTSEGGSAIVVGLRLNIPTVSYHVVQEGETWAAVATRYYGDPSRAFALIEANGGSAGEHPDPGAELLIPYPLRHVSGQADTLRKVAKTYYKSLKGMKTIRRFNQIKRNRLTRGQIVLIPLDDLVLSKSGKEAVEQAGMKAPEGGAKRDKQQAIDQELPALREHVRAGRSADAVAMSTRLIGAGDLTGNQIVTINRELGTALVALGRGDLAIEAFKAVLAQQPYAELDAMRTSPKVLAVFTQAQKLVATPPKQDKAKRAKGKKRTSKSKSKKSKSKSKGKAKAKAKAKAKNAKKK
ncbi:MAG: LysM domain-containing protein [Myxococcales bacterium]|nr:LysM domain-containing protein [Myxococcales bacterium]